MYPGRLESELRFLSLIQFIITVDGFRIGLTIIISTSTCMHVCEFVRTQGNPKPLNPKPECLKLKAQAPV